MLYFTQNSPWEAPAGYLNKASPVHFCWMFQVLNLVLLLFALTIRLLQWSLLNAVSPWLDDVLQSIWCLLYLLLATDSFNLFGIYLINSLIHSWNQGTIDHSIDHKEHLFTSESSNFVCRLQGRQSRMRCWESRRWSAATISSQLGSADDVASECSRNWFNPLPRRAALPSDIKRNWCPSATTTIRSVECPKGIRPPFTQWLSHSPQARARGFSCSRTLVLTNKMLVACYRWDI